MKEKLFCSQDGMGIKKRGHPLVAKNVCAARALRCNFGWLNISAAQLCSVVPVWPTGILRCRFSQKQQLRKIKSIHVSAQDAFSLKGFQKHPKVSTYLIKEHLDVKKRHLSILKSWSPWSNVKTNWPGPPPGGGSASPRSSRPRPGATAWSRGRGAPRSCWPPSAPRRSPQRGGAGPVKALTAEAKFDS